MKLQSRGLNCAMLQQGSPKVRARYPNVLGWIWMFLTQRGDEIITSKSFLCCYSFFKKALNWMSLPFLNSEADDNRKTSQTYTSLTELANCTLVINSLCCVCLNRRMRVSEEQEWCSARMIYSSGLSLSFWPYMGRRRVRSHRPPCSLLLQFIFFLVNTPHIWTLPTPPRPPRGKLQKV